MQYDIQLKLFKHFACIFVYKNVYMYRICMNILYGVSVMPRHLLSNGPKNGRCQRGTDQNLLKRKSEGFLT